MWEFIVGVIISSAGFMLYNYLSSHVSLQWKTPPSTVTPVPSYPLPPSCSSSCPSEDKSGLYDSPFQYDFVSRWRKELRDPQTEAAFKKMMDKMNEKLTEITNACVVSLSDALGVKLDDKPTPAAGTAASQRSTSTQSDADVHTSSSSTSSQSVHDHVTSSDEDISMLAKLCANRSPTEIMNDPKFSEALEAEGKKLFAAIKSDGLFDRMTPPDPDLARHFKDLGLTESVKLMFNAFVAPKSTVKSPVSTNEGDDEAEIDEFISAMKNKDE